MESRKIFRFEFNNYKMFLLPILYVLTTMTIFYLIRKISISWHIAATGCSRNSGPAFLPKGPWSVQAVVEPLISAEY